MLIENSVESVPLREKRHIALVGAGVVGAVLAVELVKRGYRVTIVEPSEPGGEHAASYGNGGWLSPSLVVPVSMPGLWRKVPGMLLNPLGPLTINWKELPRLAPWLWRFLLSGATFNKVERTALALQPLVADCHEHHFRLANEIGVGDLIERNGQLQVYRSRDAFLDEAAAWKLRRMVGGSWRELDETALRVLEPELDSRYKFGVVLEGYNCISPGKYVAALVKYAEGLGARVVKSRVTGFVGKGNLISALATETGDILCDEAVVCAGINSKPLAKAAGDRVMMEAERGYHVQMTGLDPLPRNRVLLMDGRMTNTPSRFGLRVTGHVEFSRLDAAPDWRRAEILRDFTLRAYNFQKGPLEAKFWMGSRPSTPDGLPVIGRAKRYSNVSYAFGHGHIGVASAPNTARAVADLIEGKRATFALKPYSPQRF